MEFSKSEAIQIISKALESKSIELEGSAAQAPASRGQRDAEYLKALLTHLTSATPTDR